MATLGFFVGAFVGISIALLVVIRIAETLTAQLLTEREDEHRQWRAMVRRQVRGGWPMDSDHDKLGVN